MLMIRLQRTGRKHEPTFRLVLTDSKNGPKSGKFLENLGWYDTRLKNSIDQIDTERVKHWISKGAQLSVTVHNFLITKKVIEGKKKNALSRKSPIKKEEAAAAPAGATSAATPAPTSAPAIDTPASAPEVVAAK